jgi:hypothetical protein
VRALGPWLHHNEPTDTTREVSMRAATKVSMKDNSTDAAATRVGRLYATLSLSLGRERRKHNHQADDTTCLPLSLHLTLSCCVTRETEGKTQKFQKIKTGAIL